MMGPGGLGCLKSTVATKATTHAPKFLYGTVTRRPRVGGMRPNLLEPVQLQLIILTRRD
jgi:hypothetical protein